MKGRNPTVIYSPTNIILSLVLQNTNEYHYNYEAPVNWNLHLCIVTSSYVGNSFTMN